jgi:hypothetical protein
VLNPLSNRSLSPANYQQLQSAMHHQQHQMGSGEKNMMIGGGGSGGSVTRKPASLGRKILGSGGLQSDQPASGGS